jgi:phosphate transport system substrate-binding protein
MNKLWLLAAAGILMVAGQNAWAVNCPTRGIKELTGAGATFPYPLYAKMFKEYNKECGVRVNFQSIGSGGGIKQLQEQTVDFGASDGIMDEKQKQEARGGKVIHVPTVAGAIAVVYNIPGVATGQLKLTPDVLADIYLKKIKQWSDSRIKAVNPDVKLPASDIAVIHRSDGSGTTYIFTNYLSKVSAEWKDKVGNATSVKWPGDVGGKGNEGVANTVKQIPGAIGYVEIAYAEQIKMAYAATRNKAGTFLLPSLESAAEAANVSNLPDNMEVMITDSSNPKAYPITGFTWLLVYENMKDAAKADTIANLAWWMIHDGERFAKPLGYAPLTGPAIQKAEALVKSIKANGTPVLK